MIVPPAASSAFTVSVASAGVVPAFGDVTPLIENVLTTPKRVIVRPVLAEPAVMVKSFVAVDSTCPVPAAPPTASYVVTEYRSVPGGDGGPGTVHGVQGGVMSVLTVGFVTVVGVPLLLISVIDTDAVDVALTYCGLRPVLEPDFPPMVSENCGVTRFPVGAVVCCGGGGDVGAVPPPPPQAASARTAARLRILRMSDIAP